MDIISLTLFTVDLEDMTKINLRFVGGKVKYDQYKTELKNGLKELDNAA